MIDKAGNVPDHFGTMTCLNSGGGLQLRHRSVDEKSLRFRKNMMAKNPPSICFESAPRSDPLLDVQTRDLRAMDHDEIDLKKESLCFYRLMDSGWLSLLYQPEHSRSS